MSRFLDKKYRGFKEYTPGEQPKAGRFIKLNTNESPYPPGPETVSAAADPDLIRSLRLYPDPELKALKAQIAENYGVEPENVFCANGSDDILYLSFMAFGEDGFVFPDITYGFYSVFADFLGKEYETPALRDDFSIDPDDYTGAGRMVVIADPNAPTGLDIGEEAIRSIAGSTDHVVLIDQAYVDFGGTSYVPLIREFDNVIICQTFSKSRSLAGARLGFAIAPADIVRDLEKLKYSTNPYSVNAVTLAAGTAALREDAYYRENCRRIMDTREWTTARLRGLGFHVLDSKTNFVFAESPEIAGSKLYEELKARGILVRHFDNERISNYNRITIGKKEDMAVLIDTVTEILGKEAAE
jgi:histidinol-phosphate aminotransferase